MHPMLYALHLVLASGWRCSVLCLAVVFLRCSRLPAVCWAGCAGRCSIGWMAYCLAISFLSPCLLVGLLGLYVACMALYMVVVGLWCNSSMIIYLHTIEPVCAILASVWAIGVLLGLLYRYMQAQGREGIHIVYIDYLHINILYLSIGLCGVCIHLIKPISIYRQVYTISTYHHRYLCASCLLILDVNWSILYSLNNRLQN